MPGELDAISLKGMRFHALVGILPREREVRQPIEVDVTAWVPPDSGVLDYRRIHQRVSAVLSAHVEYIEDVATRVAASMLEEAQVGLVSVTVRKPEADVGGPISHAEVAIVRRRDA